MRRALALLLALLAALGLTACSGDVRMEHCELGIVLPDGFEPYDSGGTFDAAYSDGELIAGLVRVSYAAALEDGIPATLTAHEFGEVYRTRAEKGDEVVFDYGDCAYFSYTSSSAGVLYRYTHTFYKTPYAYFVISFISIEGGEWGVEDTLKLTKSVYLINI